MRIPALLFVIFALFCCLLYRLQLCTLHATVRWYGIRQPAYPPLRTPSNQAEGAYFKNRVCTAIMTQPAATQGLARSPMRAAFHAKLRKPCLCRSRIVGASLLAWNVPAR